MERLTLRESFVNGLRNKPYVNSSYLTACSCLRATETGLVPFRSIDDGTLPALAGNFGAQIDYVGKNILVFNGNGLYTTAGVNIPIYCADGQWVTFTLLSGTVTPVILARSDGIGTILIKATDSGSVGTTAVITVGGVPIAESPVTLTADFKEYSFAIDAAEQAVVTVGGSDKGATASAKNCEELSSGDGSFERASYVEFGDVWFASTRYGDRPIFFYHTPANGTLGAVAPLQWAVYCTRGYADELTQQYNKTIGAVEGHMGRLYLAGFNALDKQYLTTEAWGGSLSWQYFWNSFLENCEIEMTHEGMSMGSTTVFYSKLNGGDYFWPFSVELAMFGLPHSTAFRDAMPFLLDGVRKHEIGFFDVPTNGTIYRMESMRESILIFATDGIYVATPQQTQFGVGHLVQRISDIPALSRTAIMGIGPAVYCINKNYRLIIITQEQGITDVDYSGYLKNLDADTIRMDYDHELNDLYISSGDSLSDGKCYVLTTTGMCEYGAPVYSFIHSDGSLLGYAGAQPSQNGNVLATVCTETLDFMERMLKEIHSMEFGLENALNIEVRVHYRTNGKLGWQYTSWHNVYDIDNFTTPIISGHDLRIELRFEIQDYADGDFTRFEYLNVLWRRGDKRNFRVQRGQV